MPTYLMLTTLTEKGIQTLKSNPARLREVNRDVEELGAKVLHQWATLGEFDFVNIVEAPDTATIARVSVALGALFVVLGNYMPKMRRNFFVGIRTPWTLADEDVWFRTHRLGGVLFVIGGVLLMVFGPFLHGRAAEHQSPRRRRLGHPDLQRRHPQRQHHQQ